jgi:hypothetical protein
MTSEPSAAEAPPPAAAGPAVRRWDRSDAIIGTALVMLIISLFLPWFSVTLRLGSAMPASGTGNGARAHGYLWVVFVLAIVALVVLVARDSISRIPGNLPSPGQLLLGSTGLALILTVLGVLFRPPGFRGMGGVGFGWTGYAPLSHFIVSVSWSYGGFVAVAAAVVAFVAAFISSGPLQEAGRAAQAANRVGPAAG